MKKLAFLLSALLFISISAKSQTTTSDTKQTTTTSKVPKTCDKKMSCCQPNGSTMNMTGKDGSSTTTTTTNQGDTAESRVGDEQKENHDMCNKGGSCCHSTTETKETTKDTDTPK